ncbi:MAG: hypothetical protein COV48_06155 [Elusimicrobia bacterium CG11_big_fil_rev_8_21_14_0_20_64_6]|nr:MAG: hypothetical protein COV48_06155 [Elusimicrobia bacterium CG11_big_fil_rev_8_21_14_0_20_64_6]
MRSLSLAALLALLPGYAAACAVCFGGAAENKGLFDGIWWGILILLSVTMSLLGSIAWLLYNVEKNRLAAENKQ